MLKQVEYNSIKFEQLKNEKKNQQYSRTYDLIHKLVNSIIDVSDVIHQFKKHRNEQDVEFIHKERFIEDFISNKKHD